MLFDTLIAVWVYLQFTANQRKFLTKCDLLETKALKSLECINIPIVQNVPIKLISIFMFCMLQNRSFMHQFTRFGICSLDLLFVLVFVGNGKAISANGFDMTGQYNRIESKER